MPHARQDRSLTCAFEVTGEELTRLDALLTNNGAACRVVFTTKEGGTLVYSTLAEALSFPNADQRAIRRIRFTSRENDASLVKVILDLEDQWSTGPNIRLEIQTEDEAGYTLAIQIEAWIRQQRPWWGFIPEIRPPLYAGAVMLTVPVVLILGTAATRGLFPAFGDPLGGMKVMGGTCVGGLAFGAVIVAFISAKWFLFPLATFAVGYGKQRAAIRRNARNWLLGGCVLAFVINLAAAFAWARLSGS